MSEPSAAVAERMAPETRETVKAFTDGGYKYGFVTDIETETIPPGLNEDVIRLLSAKKNEPQFLLDFRLKAYAKWLTMTEPTWPKVGYPKIDFNEIIYYSAPKQKKELASLDEVDPELLATYEKLGISLGEQKRLSNVAVDAVFDSVSVATTFKDKLLEMGVIFCSFSEAVKDYPELIEQYLGSVECLARARSAMCPRACIARWSCRHTSGLTPLAPVSLNARC